jgi:hypothetical protein
MRVEFGLSQGGVLRQPADAPPNWRHGARECNVGLVLAKPGVA